MTANFSQSDARGRTLPARYHQAAPAGSASIMAGSANMLIVGDGRALTFIDYDVGQRQRWPINNSPLSVLLNPDQDLGRFARVVQNDARVLMIEARDARRREFGTITVAFAKVAGAPAGLMLQGWNTIDAQNNLTTVRLSDQRFNVPVADSAFPYREPTRRGPRGSGQGFAASSLRWRSSTGMSGSICWTDTARSLTLRSVATVTCGQVTLSNTRNTVCAYCS